MHVCGDPFFYIDLQKVTETNVTLRARETPFVVPTNRQGETWREALRLVWAPTLVRHVSLSEEHAQRLNGTRLFLHPILLVSRSARGAPYTGTVLEVEPNLGSQRPRGAM